jgi:hypothetical protein
MVQWTAEFSVARTGQWRNDRMTLQKCVKVSCTFYFSAKAAISGCMKKHQFIAGKPELLSSVMRTSRVLVLLRDTDITRAMAWSKHVDFFLSWLNSPPVGQGHLIHEASRSDTTTHHSR